MLNDQSPMSGFASKRKKSSNKTPKQKKPSKPPNPSKSSGLNIDFQIRLCDEVTFYKHETKIGLDKMEVEGLVNEYSKINTQKINDLDFRLTQLEDNERRLVNEELGQRLNKLEAQLRSGASKKQIIEAHAQGANENMKGVLTGVSCAILVGLLVLGAWSYASRESSAEAAAGVDDGDDSDDNWQNAAKGSSVEQLEFAMVKLRKMKV